MGATSSFPPDWIGLLLDAVVACAAAVGVAIAYVGLKTWRQQLKGRTEYDLARRYLLAVYKLRDTFALLRNPWIGGKAEEHENPADYRVRVLNQRLGQLFDSWSALQVEATEAEVLWGSVAKDALEPLRECLGSMVSTVAEYSWLHKSDHQPGATVDRNPERMQEADQKMFFTANDPNLDPFLAKILKAAGQAEQFIRPHLVL